MTKRRPLALGAAAAIGFGSLFFAAPALAEEAASLPVTDQTEEQAVAAEKQAPGAEKEAPEAEEIKLDDVERVAEALAAENVELYGSVIASGDHVLLTSEVEQGSDAEEAVEAAVEAEGAERYLQLSGPATPIAATDVVGGAGYLGWLPNPEVNGGGTCSTGFSAFDSSGAPAVVTAGHCSRDDALSDVALTLPSAQPGAPGGGEGAPAEETFDLGTFGFTQFGGLGNSTGANGDPSSTDIAIIEDINPELDLKPEVTDWTTANTNDLSASTTPITSVGTVSEGDVVTHSGRTTGSKSGNVIMDGYITVGGFNGEGDDRYVHGFGAQMIVDPGDSGGAIVRGETAVGIASAEAKLTDGTEIIWGTHLQSGLEQVPGNYEIALDIDEPEVTSHSDGAVIAGGTTISGTAPSNAEEVSVSTAEGTRSNVSVEDSTWSFTAPTEPGEYTLSYSARNGHSTSETAQFNFTVEEESDVDRPAVTSPANGSTVAPLVETIEGTGIPGAELTMSGDVNSTVTVDEDGSWSVPTSLDVGSYSISVYQTVEGVNSNTVNSSFTVEEESGEIAPIEITSISDGDEFQLSDAPTSVSGTAEPGETVVVAVQASGSGDAGAPTSAGIGEAVQVEVGGDGSWTHALDYEPALGAFDIFYGYEGAGSGSVISFTLVEDGTTPPPGDDEDPPAEDEGNNGGGGNGGDDELAETGLDTMPLLPFIGAAAAMLLLGTAVTLFAARRQKGGNATE